MKAAGPPRIIRVHRPLPEHAMSQHAIEDLVEHTIRLVDRSDAEDARKAALIGALLQLQARYDTGLTWFRLSGILLRHGVLQRTPVASVEDAGLRARAEAAQAPGWLDEAGDEVYVQCEDGARVLYRQPGPAVPLPLPDLFEAVLALAETAGDTELGTDWYGLLVNGWLDGTFDAGDGVPATLDGLLASAPLQAIRALAARNAFKRRRGAHEDLALPRLADGIDADETEREYGLRFFLQPKRAPAALRAARDRALARRERAARLIPALVEARLGDAMRAGGWRPVAAERDGQWIWVMDADGQRRFAWFTHDAGLGELIFQLGLQHARLLAWERREASEALHDLHFQHMAVGFMPEPVRGGPDIGAFGGWALDPARPDAQLAAAIDRLAAALPDAFAGYFGFVDRHFPEPLFARDPDVLLHLLEEGDEDGTVPPDVLFDSADSLLLAFAFHRLERGEDAAAESMVARLKARLAQRGRLNPWLRDCLVPFLRRWDEGGRAPPMPPVLHALLAAHLRARDTPPA